MPVLSVCWNRANHVRSLSASSHNGHGAARRGWYRRKVASSALMLTRLRPCDEQRESSIAAENMCRCLSASVYCPSEVSFVIESLMWMMSSPE